MRLATALLAMFLIGCGGPRTVLRPSALRGVARVCLRDMPSTAPADLMQGVHGEVETALLQAGVEVAAVAPCDLTGEISIVSARPWVFGWISDGLLLRLRGADGVFYGSVEYSTPGGVYVSSVLKPFAAEVLKAFQGAR